jgi:plastocyanin
MSRLRIILSALVVLPALAACAADATAPADAVAPTSPRLSTGSSISAQRVELRDDCDSVSFNKVLGPGGCIRRGSVTFEKFMAELTEKRSVGAWWINPREFSVKVGTPLDVVNTGGEVHTYTRVAQYAGGIVTSLNTLAGLTTKAPECANMTVVPAGGHQHVPTGTGGLAAGTYRFQCCFHPWMKSTVTVKSS